MRLKAITENSSEYATIRCEGLEETKIDISQISDYVVSCTDHLTGTPTGISSKPIFLTVYKSDIQYDLTLIDLPGMIHAERFLFLVQEKEMN